jgi:uncharacterized circularly permuted ATP-grasp superfamily protein/uncharacterized alpha-E superfamily protein
MIAFDECFDGAGSVRAHWRELINVLGLLGDKELEGRMENGRRILAEHGVTCFANSNGRGVDQPWHCDLIPFVIEAGEWRVLEAGLAQRARLLNLVLGDLYGTQRLVRDGLVPAPLVFANPGYLRACQAIEVPGGAYLQVYSADLARSPNGQWWILADRTQAPAGIGFALENRSVVSRILPEAMRELRPRSISDTLRIRRDALRYFAPRQSENPAIALLSPGPRNESYFEHAYLARLLGLALVEGGDLTVRNRRLFLKTLDGLRPVDVVLRCVGDAFCDPLELRGDSLLGVPGLVEAARAGHVSLGNALGTGLLESPGFMPFLPGLCRHLLDEELLVPSLATWWCGQASEHNYVREHSEELAIRSSFLLGGDISRLAALDSVSRQDLFEQVRQRPHEFVGQEQVCLSQVPVWGGPERSARPVVLRMFVLHDGTDFKVMPGGLARVLKDGFLGSSSMTLNGMSKDVWVLPDTEVGEPVIHSLGTPPGNLDRAPSDLPSRAAENFFWLGRYTERLEQVVRVSLNALGRLTEDSSIVRRERLAPLERMLARLRLVSGTASTGSTRETLQKEILLLLFQEDRVLGVRDLLKRIHLAGFSVRDRLSADTWRILNRLEPDARQRPGRLPLVQASSTLHTLVMDLAAFSGMEMENMTRGHGWAFLDMGRRLERAISMARLMEAVLRGGQDVGVLLETALEIGDSVMTHRRRFFAEPQPASTLEVLVHERANPRSLAFQLSSLCQHAEALPLGANPQGVGVVQSRVSQLLALLQRLEPDSGTETTPPASAAWQADLLAQLAVALEEVSELLTQLYFSHVMPQVN